MGSRYGKKAYVNGLLIALNVLFFLYLEITGSSEDAYFMYTKGAKMCIRDRLCGEKRPGRCEKFCGRVSCGEKKRRRTDADHHQDRRDHRGKDPDPGGDPDGNGIKTHGAKDYEWDSRLDRNLH